MMENAWRPSILFLADRRRLRLLVCLLIGISTLYGFRMFHNMHEYMPWYRRIPKALAMTLEVHAGLWLGTLQLKGRWRFVVAAFLIPSGVGAYLLFWNYNLLTIVAAALALSWLLYKVLRGERFED
jgi:hypothetical protein